MNKIEELLKEVKDKFNDEPCVKEYFRLKEIIDNDKELQELDKKMRLHQKEMCEHQDNDEMYFKEKELYESCLAKIESNPIYINFNEVKKEVNALLIEMRDFLS